MACCGETGRPDEGLLAREDARAPRRHGRVAFQRAAPIHRERVALHGAGIEHRVRRAEAQAGALVRGDLGLLAPDAVRRAGDDVDGVAGREQVPCVGERIMP